MGRMAFMIKPPSQITVDCDILETNLRPIAILTSYMCLAFALTALILRTIYQIYSLPRPSHQIIPLHNQRWIQIRTVGTLAVTSLAVTWFYMFKFFGLSYRTWARERGMCDALGDHSPQLFLGQWLKETSLFRDAWETVIEESNRFWWSQQVFLITTVWSVYVGIEGYRYNIRHLWAFMLLGQIVAISFAVNLFFLAILFSRASSWEEVHSESPFPSTSNYKEFQQEDFNSGDDLIRDSKAIGHTLYNSPHLISRKVCISNDSSWTSYGLLYYISLSISFTAIALIPYSSNTSMFLPTLAIPHALLFLPLYIPSAVRGRRRISQTSADAPSRQFLQVYKLVFCLAICLHIKATVVVLLDTTPDGHSIQDDVTFRVNTNSSRQRKARGTAQNLLDSLNGHPAVSSVGWDVIMCYLGVILWAIIQRADIWIITCLDAFSSVERGRDNLANTKNSLSKHNPSKKND